MKALFQCTFLSLLVLAAAAIGSAQISITSADVSSQFTPGHTLTTKIDTATHTVNIGSLGATSWDFSAIVTNYTASSATVRPDTTPYTSDFPTATNALRASGVYIYYQLGADLLELGAGLSSPFDIRIKNNPAQVLYHLPMTLGTSWTATYAETSKVPSLSITTVTNWERVNTVDAYGNMTLPGGAVYSAIRLKIDSRSHGTSNSRSIGYQFLAKNGAAVYVAAADTLQADIGTISVSSTSWNNPIVGTSVLEMPSNGIPSRFELGQNYPNPFNPSTTIPFSIEQNAFVSMKLYDILGHELTTLVSEQLSPGSYAVRWDASAYPSGMYMYRLQAGAAAASKTLLLIR